MGGVRACWMPPLLKDSERGGRVGSEIRLETLCCNAGEDVQLVMYTHTHTQVMKVSSKVCVCSHVLVLKLI